jgi:uncharacterized protein (TIGR00661 family)
MVRVLYGVMGNTHGHVMRSLALARALPDCEFHFIGGGRVPPAARAAGFPVTEVPVLRTVHKQGAVSIPAVLGQVAGRLLDIPAVLRRLDALIHSWQPQLAIIDREFFLPLACRRAGLDHLALNHSGLLLSTRYPIPPGQHLSHALAMLNDRALFDFTLENWSVSFYHPPLKNRKQDRLFHPVLRGEVRRLAPTGHDGPLLVYQTSKTFAPLLDALRAWNRPAVLYGFTDTEQREGPLHFKPYHFTGILEDLAACSFVIANGGHNLLTEAFHLHKPVLRHPIANLFEQALNAHYVRELGYGDYSTSRRPQPGEFSAFAQRLEEYRARLREKFRDGTGEVLAALRRRLGLPSPP